jgi:hypothetical protein
MPIRRFLEPGVFDPEHVATLVIVFDDVLDALGLVDRTDPVTTLVAQKVIELAKAGVRDPIRLKRLTLEAFQQPSGQKPN